MSETPRRNERGRQRNRGGKKSFSASAPSQRRRTSDPARSVAFTVLQAVTHDDAYANLVLPSQISRARLDRRDAAFATELTYGTLRMQGSYDTVLSRCVDRELTSLDAPVLDALRLGMHQLMSMRVDNHAAVNETVALVRDRIGAGPSGLVNAVLRRAAEKNWDQWLHELTEDLSGDDALALRYAHPAWVVRALRQSLKLHGRDAEIEALLKADNAAPEVHLVGLPGVGGGAAGITEAMEHGAQASEILDGAAIYSGGDVGRLPGVSAGAVRVQDSGSQWMARALAEPAVLPGERWLDLCAGPGGKAALLAALAAEFGATLTANEPSDHRAELVRTALSPIDPDAWSVRAADGRTIAEATEHEFDRILVDAPCTGLGALRRRPESRWRRQPRDIPELTALQSELLDAAVGVLAADGLLAYVTCSPHMAETVLQVEDLMKRHPELELLDAHEVAHDVALPAGQQLIADRPETAHPTASRCVQLWPHVHSTDAMFLALFRKQAV